MKNLYTTIVAIVFSLLCGCASSREIVITINSALPDAVIAQVGANPLTTEYFYALIEKEKAEADKRGVQLLPVVKVDDESPYSRLESVLECCGVNGIKTLIISGPRSSFTVHIGPERRQVDETYVFVTLAMSEGTGDILAGVRESAPGEVGTDRAASVVQEFEVVRAILNRAKERLAVRTGKPLTVLIDPKPNLPLSKVLTMLSICDELGLAPEFISPKWTNPSSAE